MARALVIKQPNGQTVVLRLNSSGYLEMIRQQSNGAWPSPAGVTGTYVWADLTAVQLSGTVGGGQAGRIEVFGTNGPGGQSVTAQDAPNGTFAATPVNLG